MNRIRIKPGDTVPVFFDEQEWQLIQREAPLSKALKKQIEQFQTKSHGVSVPFTLDDLEELAHIALKVSEKISSEYKQKIWQTLFARFRTMLDTYTDGDDGIWGEIEEEFYDFPDVDETQDFPPELEKRIQEVMKNSSKQTLDEVNSALENARLDYNQMPQDDLGGLSPEQVYYLVYCDWDDPKGPMKINTSLSLDDLKSVPFFQNTHIFLNALLEEDGKTKATGNGNLNRKFVEKIFEQLVTDPEEFEMTKKYNKVINEIDAQTVHITRILLDLAGYIKLRSKWFSITQKGKKILKDDQAGACFAHLFKSFFLRFNLSYLDGCQENLPLQSTIVFTLHQLQNLPKKWMELGTVTDKIVLPVTMEAASERRWGNEIHTQIYLRILKPLQSFGLVEYKEKPRDPFTHDDKVMFRKTPLLDRFLQFDIKG